MLIVKVCLLFLIVCTYGHREGYINNKSPKDEPDDLQFYACHDYSSNKNLGNNNYKLKKHGISEPLQGTYSYFLDIYGIRNYDEIFHAPICESKYNFSDISNLSAPEILDLPVAMDG